MRSSSSRRVASLIFSSASFSFAQRAASTLALLLGLAERALDRLAHLLGLLRHRRELDLELHHAPVRLVELERRGVDLHPQARGCLVDQVDRLVRQEPVGDVALGEHCCGDERRVPDPHAVMGLVALLETAKDRDRVLDGGLVDDDGREAALESSVLLDVLAVLVESRCSDAAELAAGEHRLEQVRGVDSTLGGAGTDDRVELVDEQHDAPLARLDLGEDSLQPLLELAAVLRAGEQRADVERPDPSILEALRNVACDDPLGEPFGDRRLADAGLADQDRVVLRATGEDLDHAADLLVAADHRIELPRLGRLGQIAAELRQRLIAALRILRCDALAAADLT